MAVAGGGCLLVRAAAGRAMARDSRAAEEQAAAALADGSAALRDAVVPVYAGAPTPPCVEDASIAARTASV